MDRTYEQGDLFGSDPVMISEDTEHPASGKIVAVVGPISKTGKPKYEGIKEAGVELQYNRRNRIRTHKVWSDFSGMNEALKAKEVNKANIWPKPAYEELIAGGMKPFVAHLLKQVYDSIASKPMLTRIPNDDDFQLYVDEINWIREGVTNWVNDPNELSKFADRFLTENGSLLSSRTYSLSSLYSKGTNPLLAYVYPQGWQAHKPGLRLCGKALGALQPGYAEVKRAVESVIKGWPAKQEAWQVQGLHVVESPEISYYNGSKSTVLQVDGKSVGWFDNREEAEKRASEFKKFVLFSKRREILSTHDTYDEAAEAARENVKREKGATVSDKGTSVTEARRTGPARRQPDEDISAERLMKEFNLKGVNFGTWMKTPAARLEAQMHLNHAFDSLHDLAHILKIEPQHVGLGGMLGLAIGAQGSGGTAAAHFVPGLNEINITRTAGAGSLAHEWFHALDHFNAYQAELGASKKPYLTVHVADSNRPIKNLPTELVDAERSAVAAMVKRSETDEEIRARRVEAESKSKVVLDSWIASFRRNFTRANLAEQFEPLVQRILTLETGAPGEQVRASKNVYLSPVIAELREIYKNGTGHLYSIEDSSTLQSCLDHAKFCRDALSEPLKHRAETKTQFVKDAIKLDGDKGGKVYWSSIEELTTRCKTAWLADRLQEEGIVNTYLTHNPYRRDETVPNDDDRKRIFPKLDAFFAEVPKVIANLTDEVKNKTKKAAKP